MGLHSKYAGWNLIDGLQDWPKLIKQEHKIEYISPVISPWICIIKLQ